jgi:hypothetical protein
MHLLSKDNVSQYYQQISKIYVCTAHYHCQACVDLPGEGQGSAKLLTLLCGYL